MVLAKSFKFVVKFIYTILMGLIRHLCYSLRKLPAYEYFSQKRANQQHTHTFPLHLLESLFRFCLASIYFRSALTTSPRRISPHIIRCRFLQMIFARLLVFLGLERLLPPAKTIGMDSIVRKRTHFFFVILPSFTPLSFREPPGRKS